jgi:hypothetical protein
MEVDVGWAGGGGGGGGHGREWVADGVRRVGRGVRRKMQMVYGGGGGRYGRGWVAGWVGRGVEWGWGWGVRFKLFMTESGKGAEGGGWLTGWFVSEAEGVVGRGAWE